MKEEIANVSANIPGTGQTPAGKPAGFGDTIVNPSARKKYISKAQPGPTLLRRALPKQIEEETFAGAMVFEVSSSLFHNLTMQKRKGKHWRTYLEEDDCYQEIREYANKNKGPIVIRNKTTNEMRYIRYKD